MSDLDVLAIRTGVAWSTEPPVVALRLTGDDAFNVLDRVCPTDLFVRDGQVRPSVLLDEQARIFADVYVGSDDDGYLLLSEGPTAERLTEHLKQHAPAGAKVAIEDMTTAHDVLSIHGPYAWELIGELLGPDLIGLPYLYFYRAEEVFCLRAGKTGEYGYDLLVPRAQTPDLVARLEEAGRAFDLRRVGLPALEQCALENGFFNVRREGARGLTPIDLGVQWRVSYRKEYVGSAALSALRAEGWARRATTVLAEQPLSAGEAVFLGDDRIGEVLTAGESTLVKAHVGLALIDRPFGHAGIDRFTAGAAAGDSSRNVGDCVPPVAAPRRVALTTVSPPVVDNRSLYINPQRHAYATRGRDIFPPIA